MSTSLSTEFKKAVIRYLHASGHAEAEEVVSWYEDHWQEGYCETCAYEEWSVDITYRKADGSKATYTYDGRFADLLEKLLAA